MIPGLAVKGGLVLALAVSLGGYTVAESATQRAAVAEQEAEVRAAAQERRDAVAAERERAVATAQGAIEDAAAVQTVAATTVAEADLAPLVEAVEELNELLVAVPTAPLPAVPGDEAAAGGAAVVAPTDLPADDEAPSDDAAAPVVERDARASRTTARESLPDAADPEAADQVEAAAEDAPVTPGADDAAEPEDAPDGGLEDATGAPTPADEAQPEDALSAEILEAVARVTEVAAQVQATADATVAAQQAAAEAAAAAAAEAQAQEEAAAAAAAAEKAAQRASLDAYANGRIPAEALCDLPDGSGHQLRCDAAEALTALDAAYRAEFGRSITVSDSYRSYAAQVACRRVKGNLCATPGTSNHGRGVAADLAGGIQTFGTPQHRWMAANAGEYGWELPEWARQSGSKPEAWHWEYTG